MPAACRAASRRPSAATRSCTGDPHRLATILRKDLLLELRTKESVPAMALFSITVYVLFHFGLDRDSLDGELASGVLWVTLLLAAVIGVTRLFAAEREQGGIDGLLLAPVDRTSLFVAKATALFLFLVAVELVAVPAFALLLLGPGLGGALPELLAILAARQPRPRGGRRTGGRARRGDARARADRAAAAAAAARAAPDRVRPGHRAAAAPERGSGGPRPLACGSSLFTMWCSCFSP